MRRVPELTALSIRGTASPATRTRAHAILAATLWVGAPALLLILGQPPRPPSLHQLAPRSIWTILQTTDQVAFGTALRGLALLTWGIWTATSLRAVASLIATRRSPRPHTDLDAACVQRQERPALRLLTKPSLTSCDERVGGDPKTSPTPTSRDSATDDTAPTQPRDDDDHSGAEEQTPTPSTVIVHPTPQLQCVPVFSSHAAEALSASDAETIAHAPPADRTSLLLLGELSVSRNGRLLRKGWRNRSLEILAYLALHPHGATKDHMITQFAWADDADPITAARSFDRATHFARARLRINSDERAYILNDRGTHRLEPHIWWTDVAAFNNLIETALSSPDAQHAETMLRDALDLYRGDVCASYDWPWLAAIREQYRQQRSRASIRLAELLSHRYAHDEALRLLDHAINVQPYNEDLWRHAIRIEAARGNRAAALQRCRQLRDQLQAELNVDPDPKTEELERELWIQATP